MFRDLIDDLDGYQIEPATFLDVPYVPSADAVVNAILDFANVGPNDTLYDLGSGDGRIVLQAALKRNARAIGVEMDPARIADAMELAAEMRLEHDVEFIEEDLLEADFSDATVVTVYLLESVNMELRPRLLTELAPGTRVISNTFDFGDWRPDDRLEVGHDTLMKWIVPAHVAGTWTWEGLDDLLYSVTLKQRYQKVTGTAEREGETLKIVHAELEGNTLDLVLSRPGEVMLEVTLIFEDGELAHVEELVD